MLTTKIIIQRFKFSLLNVLSLTLKSGGGENNSLYLLHNITIPFSESPYCITIPSIVVGNHLSAWKCRPLVRIAKETVNDWQSLIVASTVILFHSHWNYQVYNFKFTVRLNEFQNRTENFVILVTMEKCNYHGLLLFCPTSFCQYTLV